MLSQMRPTKGRANWWQLLLATIVLFIPNLIYAQSGPNGSLSGTLSDQNGALVTGATVTVKNINTGLTRTATTSAEGHWSVPVLPVGTYSVTYTATGFKKTVREAIAVEASVPRTLDDKMEAGDVSISIDITAENTPLATPETATTARQITGEEVVRLPTSTRSFTQLLSSEAGVSTELSPVATNGNGNQSPSVNGTRTTSTSLFFNGIDATNITSNEGSLTNNIAPAPETLAEVKLQTSLYDASTGRSGGGNFQLITKSGGNQFNGSAYYYIQNEALNANDFFFNKDGIERPKARRNEGGFTIGGPIVKNRFFFFGGYQRTAADTGFVPTASSISVLPGALRLISGARTADNIAAAFNNLNPTLNLTAAQVSPIALRLLNLKNPVTNDFVIPAPRANATLVGNDANAAAISNGAATTIRGGNPFYRQRNVSPAQFTQDQFTLKLDGRLSENNNLSGTLFYANFPGFDPFPDPSSLISPFTLKRDDRNRTLSLTDTHIFSPTLINEVRFGYFNLDNTRTLDDPFLTPELSNAAVGINNPALFFDTRPATTRLGHYVGRPGTLLERFSFGGPNDVFNERKQKTYSISDNVTYLRGKHTFRFGGDFKRTTYDTNLPEEQETEFEKYDNFTQLLLGLATEADTQFGITQKNFIFRDTSGYFTDDWKVNRKLSLNVGVRWEMFGWPEERNGRIGNFDPSLVTGGTNPLNGFLVPSNATGNTGFVAVDTAINATTKANTKHTLNGQDLNNFAPRIGIAFSPLASNKLVLRGGYGLFFDRPSASFSNTIFSNYPFLREVEVTYPTRAVPLGTAFSQQLPTTPFNQYLPNRIVRTAGANGSYDLRDGTPTTRGADGTLNPIDPATGQPFVGNIAETFEFRAVDRNLKTPFVHQWNIGAQYEIGNNFLVEARYIGTRGRKLLQAVSFSQGYDLNDTSAPDAVFERFNSAYVAAGSPNGALNTGTTARARGVGRAFGFANASLGGMIDYNLANASGAVISFEARSPFLGFDVPEAILLGNSASSSYHSGQFSLTKRLSQGLQFNLAYTFSKSLDNSSADPGSTAGGGKPDLPNVGFTAQGNAFNTDSNRAVSDFDRPHRFSLNFVYELPAFGAKSRFAKGWQISGFAQTQSGTPYSIFATETVATNASQYNNLRLGSAGLYRLAFGRPSLCGTLDQLRQQGSDPTAQAFNAAALCSPLSLAGGYPNNRGFGNLGRNILRSSYQKRIDMGLSKNTQLTERVGFEFRWDIFNVFNNVNFGAPNNVIGEAGTDFGTITDTVGGPRVMQFGFKLKF